MQPRRLHVFKRYMTHSTDEGRSKDTVVAPVEVAGGAAKVRGNAKVTVKTKANCKDKDHGETCVPEKNEKQELKERSDADAGTS